MPSIGLTLRFIAALVAATLFAGVAAIGLWSHDQMARRDRALQAHVMLVLQDLAGALETRLALGLPLAQLPEVDRLLDIARLQLPAARSLAVLDEQGRGLFSTTPVEVGETLAIWGAAGPKGGGYRKMDEDEVFWLPLDSDDGGVAGAVLLRLPAGSSDEGVLAFALALTVRAAPALAALAMVAAGLGFWLARVAGRRAAVTAAALTELADNPDADVRFAAAHGLPGLPLADFAAAAAMRRRRLAAAEEELGRLDEMA